MEPTVSSFALYLGTRVELNATDQTDRQGELFMVLNFGWKLASNELEIGPKIAICKGPGQDGHLQGAWARWRAKFKMVGANGPGGWRLAQNAQYIVDFFLSRIKVLTRIFTRLNLKIMRVINSKINFVNVQVKTLVQDKTSTVYIYIYIYIVYVYITCIYIYVFDQPPPGPFAVAIFPSNFEFYPRPSCPGL